MYFNRRKFLLTSSQAALAVGLMGCQGPSKEAQPDDAASQADTPLFFDISLAQWSLHKAFFDGSIDPLDFAATAKNEFNIGAIEYVSQFYKDYGTDKDYMRQLKQRADDNGVKSLIIMIDLEGNLGETDDKIRQQAVENHYKWVEAAQILGCHSIRVNAFGEGTPEAVGAAATKGLSALATFAKDYNINVLVENHGSYSSDADWMMKVMNDVNMPNCGMLPDFGNFCVEREGGHQWKGECIKEYDRYKGVELFMPKAMAVSAKTYNFDESGNETLIDYERMLKIVKDGGYKGYIGVEYEGQEDQKEGIRKTIALLERAGRAVM